MEEFFFNHEDMDLRGWRGFLLGGSKYRGDFVDRWRVIRREAERRVIGEQRFLEIAFVTRTKDVLENSCSIIG